MKRFLLLLLALLLLAGCANEDVLPTDPVTDPTETMEATEPAAAWVEELGMDWDLEGILKEMPLTIPDGLHYTASMEFSGDLLMWSLDSHLAQSQMEFCVVELDTGVVTAQRDLPVQGYAYPQILGDFLYICDGLGGKITEMDKKLEVTNQWEVEPTEGSLYMGGDGIAYCNTQDSRLLRLELNTGENSPLLEGDPRISWVNPVGPIMVIRYYHPDNGMTAYCALDLLTGSVTACDADSRIDSVSRVGTAWLYEKYGENYIYYLYTDDGASARILPEGMTLSLQEEGRILGVTLDSSVACLYDMEGKLISQARITENEMGYLGNSLIWNEVHGGYFFVFRSFEETSRLLFWDISAGTEGDDLPTEPVPEPDESQFRLEKRAKALGEKYGLVILVGTQCDTVFDEFTATLVTDYDRVDEALDTLERALSAFPAPFIRQLRYGQMQGIRIHLVSDLQATGGGRTGGGYNAFTQNQWDHTLMVMDIDASVPQTYFHEFSHIIDRCLEWDAEQRSDALFSEDKWASLNPDWFDGYSMDYSQEHSLWDDDSFIDGYATISPTEDRARVLEYAIGDTENFHFDKDTVLYRKLEYYCRCIRDAFVTDGWADSPLWEQFL